MSAHEQNDLREDLVPVVRDALEAMLTTAPTEQEIDAAMQRLRTQSSRSLTDDRPAHRIGKKPLWLAMAASVAFVAMSLLAASETWANFTRDFQSPANEPQIMSTLDLPATEVDPTLRVATKDSPGIIVRLILMTHVLSLLIGLLGMILSWLTTMYAWFRTQILRKTAASNRGQLSVRILTGALAFYCLGILFGMFWSQATWGRLWSWDPREAFALITVGLSAVWLMSWKSNTVNDETSKSSLQNTAVATIVLGIILLMFSLGGIYAANSHSYGFPSTVPTAITTIFGTILLALWATRVASARRAY